MKCVHVFVTFTFVVLVDIYYLEDDIEEEVVVDGGGGGKGRNI